MKAEEEFEFIKGDLQFFYQLMKNMLQNIILSDTICPVVGKLPNTGKEVLL